MYRINFGVVVFPGTNCDRDTLWVLQNVLHQNARLVWHTESDIDDIDVIILPGGFSYGDHLRAGAVSRFSSVMKSIIEHANKGKYVLGICNGFQILTEVGLLRGAFLRNSSLHFLCRHQHLKVHNNNNPFANKYSTGQIISIPIAHAEGNYYLTPDDLKYTLDNDLIVFQYCDQNGIVNQNTNPNGSLENIAAVMNQKHNVLGMMPHPERASEPEMGSTDGRLVFESLIDRVLQ